MMYVGPAVMQALHAFIHHPYLIQLESNCKFMNRMTIHHHEHRHVS